MRADNREQLHIAVQQALQNLTKELDVANGGEAVKLYEELKRLTDIALKLVESRHIEAK